MARPRGPGLMETPGRVLGVGRGSATAQEGFVAVQLGARDMFLAIRSRGTVSLQTAPWGAVLLHFAIFTSSSWRPCFSLVIPAIEDYQLH